MPSIFDYVTLVLLVASLIVFSLLAARSRGIRTFQFQVSVFIGLMVLGAIVELGSEDGIIMLPPNIQELGFLIHAGSMAFFSLMIWLRYYSSKREGRTLLEETD